MIRGEGFVMVPPKGYLAWIVSPICWLFWNVEQEGFATNGPLSGGVNGRQWKDHADDAAA